MLTQVRFQGIKVLGDVATELRPFTVMVGPNGCGKSTLLDQIEVLCLGSEPRVANDLPCRLDQVLGANDSRVSVRPTLGHAGASTWVGENGARLRLVMEALFNFKSDHWEPSVVETWVYGTNTLLKKDAPRSRDLVDSALRQHFSWRCQRLRLAPDAIAAPSGVDVVRLSPNGSGLPTVLKDLAANDTDAFAALQEDLRVVVPSFGRFRFGKDPVRDQRGEVLSSGISLLMERRGGGLVPLVNVSDGTRVAMALLTAIHNPDLPSLVLMDDIDHGLHLSAQYEVIAAIRRVMARRPELQVICTTHSPVLLDSFSPDEVRVMALGPDGLARVQPLSAHPPVDGYRSGFSSGELWANLGEDWVAHG